MCESGDGSGSVGPGYLLGSWDWLCELMGVDPDEVDGGFVSGA